MLFRQEFQAQWEVAVDLIYFDAIEFLRKCSSFHLKVVGEDTENENQSQEINYPEGGITDTQV